MDMTGKNGQPSMEEILASIRRIIAEEPADAISLDFKPRSGLVPGNGAEHLVDDQGDFELPAIFRPERPASTGRLFEALRVMPQLDAATARAEPEFPLPSGPHISAELHPQANSDEAQRNADTHRAAAAHLALSSLRASVRSDAAQTDMPVTPAAAETPHAAATADPFKLTTLPVEPSPVESSDANAPAVARTMAPFKDQHFSRMFAAPATAASAAPDSLAPVASALFAAPEPAPAADLANPAGAIVPPPLNGYANDSYPSGLATAHAQPPQPSPYSLTAALRAAEDARAAPPPAAPLPPPISTAANGGGIEDATAELLRPMLRQWLSDNMPRMVEKALHIEVAESVKPVKKP